MPENDRARKEARKLEKDGKQRERETGERKEERETKTEIRERYVHRRLRLWLSSVAVDRRLKIDLSPSRRIDTQERRLVVRLQGCREIYGIFVIIAHKD